VGARFQQVWRRDSLAVSTPGVADQEQSMIYFCCDEKRRIAVKAHPGLNGIDFLEVLDDPALPAEQRQRTLFVHFLKADGLSGLKPANIRCEGGERVRDVAAVKAEVDASDARVLLVTVSRPGDFSTYTLRLVKSPADPARPDGFDPILSAVDFSFKVECPTDFDCKPEHACPPQALPAAEIDYLAKDYAGFRRLMLDRLSALMPDWRERNPADLGVALVEVLAYVADHLSYRQDAIATEAYLGTARRRVSVRRHARLVDYRMHEGCNARAWLHVRLDEAAAPAAGLRLPRVDATGLRTRFLTRCVDGKEVKEDDLPRVLAQSRPGVFEPMAGAVLYREHNEMAFYTWGEAQCCLPAGAMKATLKDDLARRLRLRPGDVLIFEERRGPLTGQPADADPARRQAVRLTHVNPAAVLVLHDGAEFNRTPGPVLTDPLNGQSIVEITWAAEDALRFPVCLSAITDAAHGAQMVGDISVALGNIVLADHGLTIEDEPLGVVPQPHLFLSPAGGAARCQPPAAAAVPPRFTPVLKEGPLTHAAPLDLAAASANASMNRAVASALPAIELTGAANGKATAWTPARDLLNSRADDREFVVEVENDRSAALRFGDDRHGRRPDPGTVFSATYRVGNGAQGNIGADALAHIVAAPGISGAIAAVRNPLAAAGGTEPASLEEVRQAAPGAFRTQERAVTPADYAAVAGRSPQIQQAAATLRWTGSWRTVFLTADRAGGEAVDAGFKRELRGFVEPYRMAGQDLEVDAPRPVPLEITLRVCVRPDHFRGDVKAELLKVFSRRTLPDGSRALFHPDNFTFGQPVYLSRIYATAQAVDGVASVEVTQFERQGRPDPQALADGVLKFARLEIPRLDNDPNFPERGVFRLIMKGGK
jgi:hypothetical protein